MVSLAASPRRRYRADIVAIVASVAAIGLALYGAPQGAPEGAVASQGTPSRAGPYLIATLLGGALGLLGLVLAQKFRFRVPGRVLIALGGISLLVAALALDLSGGPPRILRIVVGLALLACAPFVGPMPPPEEQPPRGKGLDAGLGGGRDLPEARR